MKFAAISYIERKDGKLLCVWNPRYGGWALPGGLVEEHETVEVALGRELREETGLELVTSELIYEGPHGIANPDPTRAQNVQIFRVLALGTPREVEDGCPVTWLSREDFLKWSPFAPLYQKVFSAVPQRIV
jgi:ADP-ribose pyrophosphatase YjhB (NUDIX family)